MGPESVLYFAHIPKTAGTSVTAALDAEFVPGAILPAQFTTEIAAARDAFRRCRFARGHLGAGLHEAIGLPGPTFTLLRSPLERTLSHIAHVQRDPFHPLHAYVRERGHDVAGFVGDPRLRPYITNLQARYLVQPAGTAAPTAAKLAGDHPAAGQVAYELAAGPPDRELLAAARRALDAMLVVGTTDDVDGALRRLARALGWRLPPHAERHNAAPEPVAAISGATRDEILRLNAVDQALYEQARTPAAPCAPSGWTWHPWRTTGDDDGWDAAEFDAQHGWRRRIGPTGVAHARLDGPDLRDLTVRGPAGCAVGSISVAR